jgi:hypothetical protein
VDDFKWAVFAFRKRHESQGALTIFATEDLIDWSIWGEIPEGKECVP